MGYDWRAQARCADADPNLFFPPGALGPHERTYYYSVHYGVGLEAKELCAQCLVRIPCLIFARDLGLVSGIWGGKTPSEIAEVVGPFYRCGDCGRRHPAPEMVGLSNKSPRCLRCSKVINAWRWWAVEQGYTQAWGIRKGKEKCGAHQWVLPDGKTVVRLKDRKPATGEVWWHHDGEQTEKYKSCCGAPVDAPEPTGKFMERHRVGVRGTPVSPPCDAALDCAALYKRVNRKLKRSNRSQRVIDEMNEEGRASCCGAPTGWVEASSKYTARHQSEAHGAPRKACRAANRCHQAYLKRYRQTKQPELLERVVP